MLLSVFQPVMADSKEEPLVLPMYCSIGTGKYRTNGFFCQVALLPDVDFPKWHCHFGLTKNYGIRELCVFQ